MPYFVQRPQVYHAEQWTGSNFAALETWAATNAPWATPLTHDAEEGTITLSPDSGGMVLETGDWLSNLGPISASNMLQMQEVPGAAPFSYSISGT